MNLFLISAPENVMNASQHQSLPYVQDHQVYPSDEAVAPYVSKL
jgi:hypothetical protein